jgi:hypothetical protein
VRTSAGWSDRLRTVEFTVALLGTLLLILVHVVVLFHAGALWRDEVNTVNLASMPSLASVWALSEYDSFPILWALVLRGWMALGLGATDFGLRVLGLAFGLGILAMLWWSARRFGYGIPMVSLVLFAASPTTLRNGDSLRAYGCGTLLMLFMLGSIWRVVEEPRVKRVAVAVGAAVLSVQALYYNAVIVLALVMGGVAVGLYHRAWRPIVVVLGVGGLAAVSLLPYLGPMRRVQRWNGLVKVPIDFLWIARKFDEAVAGSGEFVIWVWGLLVALALCVWCWRILSSDAPGSQTEKDLAVFLGVAIVTGVVCYAWFLKVLSYTTEPWYYMTIMALLGVSLDATTHLAIRDWRWWRVARVAVFVGLVLLISGNVWRAAHVRQTNVDLVAARLTTLSTRDDLIIVYPWWPGLTFTRYYKGPTPWVTLPDVPEHDLHRYDAVKQKMLEPEPIRPILKRTADALRAGHRVWLVGGIRFLSPGEEPGYLPPPPLEPWGWNEGPYLVLWQRQVAFLIQTRAERISQVPVPADAPVNPHENLPLFVAQGWR